MLNEKNLHKLDEIIKKYPEPRAALLPALWIAQEQEGFISVEMMKHIAHVLHLDYAHVLGVVTFYTMFHDKPVGKYHIEVCTNVSCLLRGSKKIMSEVENFCGIKKGEVSKDGKWSIEEVECMGACGNAPMFAIGEEYFENLDSEKVRKILNNVSDEKFENEIDDDEIEFGGGK